MLFGQSLSPFAWHFQSTKQSSSLILLAGVVLLGIFMLSRMDSLWSTSVDLAHHTALTTRLMEKPTLGVLTHPSLGEMAIYPRYAHLMSAVIAHGSGSAVRGISTVSLVSLAILWLAIMASAATLPDRLGIVYPITLASLFVANDLFIHLELFGSEIRGNFFFAQLVGQAMAVVVVAAFVFVDKYVTDRRWGYLFLLCTLPILVGTHLLPALEILVFLMVNVTLDFLLGREQKRSVIPYGIAAALVGVLIVTADPTMDAMRRISENDGGLGFRYTPDVATITLFAGLVASACGAILLLWRKRLIADLPVRQWSFLRAYCTFGLAIASLCLLQALLLKFGYGSPYAVKKYVFGLNTVCFLLIALFLAMAIVAALRHGNFRLPGQRHAIAVALCLTAVMLLATPNFYPSARRVDVARLANVERAARLYRSKLEEIPGKNAYAIGIKGFASTLNYLITIGPLAGPRDPNAFALLLDKPLPEKDVVAHVLTSRGTSFDVVECRELGPKQGLFIVSGECVFKRMEQD